MPRLFIALEMPEAAQDSLSEACGNLPGADWTESEKFHLTLRFLGETDTKAFWPFRKALRPYGRVPSTYP